MKKVSKIEKSIKSIWASFKDKPMKFGIGMMLISFSVFVFFGDIKFKASYEDVKVELSTTDTRQVKR